MSGDTPYQSDTAYCAGLVRGSDFERYAATLFTAPEPRRALLAVFGFNIEVARIREQISQPLAGEIRLQWWTDLLAGMAHGDAAGNPVAAELMQAIERHTLSREALDRIVDAHRFDLYDEPMSTMAELETYLQNTASALFGVSAHILGGDVQGDRELLRHAGLAFGLTRILEALPRHASRGQIYLPLDELDRAGVAMQDVLAGKSTPQLQALLHDLGGQAREHLQLASESLSRGGTTARAAFLPLALVDRKLRRLKTVSQKPFEAQVTPSNLATLWTLWRASRSALFRA